LIAYHDQLEELWRRYKEGEDGNDDLSVGLYTNKKVSHCARNSGWWSLVGISKYYTLLVNHIEEERRKYGAVDSRYLEQCCQQRPVKRRRLDPNIEVYEGNLSGNSDNESGVPV
jgi:hypothetical protein